ncbi:MAG TPA: hypothetical protein VNX68_11840 [Nitrosopumilaceae archaeon]|jgi:hypothetical protein|nr:hypothetical protein [Nitrosopumilaceae archaeon]
MTCKGICTRYKAQKPVGTGRYASGQKRCQICEIFIKWEGLWCPCCGYRLRTKPRNLKYKAKLRARVEADSQLESVAVKAAEVEEIEVDAIVVKKATKKAKTAKATKKVAIEPVAIKAKTAKATKKVAIEPVAIKA